jgi:hypothetical protein
MSKSSIPDLSQIIRDNPGGTVQIDNDNWQFYRVESEKNPHQPDTDDHEDWFETDQESRLVITSDDKFSVDGVPVEFSEGYGGDILKALASIVGIRIENA